MTTRSPSTDVPVARFDPSRREPSPRLDEFVVLAPRRDNPRADLIEARSLELAQQLGLVNETGRARFDAFNSLGRHVYPDAPVERGLACAMWCNWLFYFDDVHDDELRSRDDQSRVRRLVDRALGLLSGARMPGGDCEPLDRLLLAFRERALALAGGAWLDRLWCTTADHMALGVLPALRNWGTSRTPPLAEYLGQREHDSAVMTAIDLIELAQGISIADAVRESAAVVRARRAACRAVAYFNDIVSFPKEVLRRGNPNNLVHVLMHARGASLEAALREATAIVNAEARALETAVAQVRASYPEGHPVHVYMQGLLAWQRGNIEWSLASPRYDSTQG